ncbi:MAG TPA: outer membrane protein assembly factor BamA [Pyrinomonadaceae bacterium]|jgi:outer membrane protein insertion porin family|nr:outer membrane protein assembly factor BamA [Pyrinomonadaceae bacterium]
MNNLRALGLAVLVSIVLAFPAAASQFAMDGNAPVPAVAPVQQVVETVDIQGNRRLRDEDLMYYIKTRPGDVYDPAALERDLKELLALNFFDKTATRVLTEDGIRGGVNVIFEVKELPIIRDLQFKGAKALTESDILKEFREKRVGVSKEAVYDPVKARAATRILREMLASKGFPNAKVEVAEDQVSATSVAITFNVEQGYRSRIVQIDFEGNQHFKDGELRNALVLVKETGLVSRVKGMDILDLRKLQYDLQKNVRSYMFSKGYFQARIGEPEVVGLGYKMTGFPILKALPLPLVRSKDDTLKIIVPVTEGKVYRVGELKVEGNSIFSEQQVLGYVGLKKGEIADGKRLQDAIYEDLKKVYGSQGFVQYNAEFDPEFKDNPSNANEGIVDITINIDEGKQFSLRRLEFTGNTFTRDKVMRREFLLNEGDIYNQQYVDISVARLNQTQYFDPLDKDQDVEIRTDEEKGDVDLIVKVKEKGRQQIQFNGGVSGIGGTFFGLEYSTNNLAGRGEILSLNVGAGNRQQTLQFSYQQPYFHDRPISVGFSVFGSTYHFFGEGTSLTQNTELANDFLFNPLATVTTSESNLFTQKTLGATVFATAPLSELFFKKRRFTQFSRLGLTYQISATSISDPAVNASDDPAARIPVIYRTPNILTSRITGTFVFDTRQPSPNGIDTNSGQQLSISLALAGLAGDVRTYSPSISYSRFIPIRNTKSKNPHVLAFRVLASTTGSWSITNKVRNANSLSFIGGVPAYERFFLGSENDIRGYDSRAIGPVAPFDTYITSRNPVLTTNASGTADTNTGLDSRTVSEIQAIGLLTGLGGANPALFTRNFRFIGGDTELLGNVEYRVPIFGPATLAAFADVGSVFNLRKTGQQVINSEFLPDETFLGAGRLTALGLLNTPVLESSFGSILYYHGRIMTKTDFINEFCRGNRFGCPTSLSPQVQQLYLRGEVQQNSVLDIDNSKFGKLKDFKASVGVEFRIQVPIVNVPFRLIWYYNPNAKVGITQELPGIFLPGKRQGFKFTVGRTF